MLRPTSNLIITSPLTQQENQPKIDQPLHKLRHYELPTGSGAPPQAGMRRPSRSLVAITHCAFVNRSPVSERISDHVPPTPGPAAASMTSCLWQGMRACRCVQPHAGIARMQACRHACRQACVQGRHAAMMLCSIHACLQQACSMLQACMPACTMPHA